ncbi:MAG: histidinol-phosphate transaminase [Nitrospinota bacterium]
MMNLKKLVPDYIRNIKPYEPGKPVEEVERELGIRRSIKMASNENPIGPSPKAIKAMAKAAKKVNYYPEGDCYYLRKKMIKKLGIKSEELIFGNGSNEIIELMTRCFARPGDNIVISQHAFLVYLLAGKAVGAEVRVAPAKNYGHDLAAMADLVDKNTKLVFIANPNNPTGGYCDRWSLTKFLQKVKSIPVVSDEAYFEYAQAGDYPDTLKLRKQFDNLITLRTFSKMYGLAGLRIGYGIGSAELVQYLNRMRQPFNVNMMAQEAAIAALSDKEYLKKSLQVHSQGKKMLFKALADNNLEYLPTETNFILVKTGNGRKVFQKMLRLGIVVRPMDVYGLPEFIRVTIGKKEQNAKFITALLKAVGRK